MKIAIVGSRNFRNYALLVEILSPYYVALPLDNLIIVSGGARGADTLGKNYAENHGLDCNIFKPDWERYGKSAGFRRNQTIVDASDIVIAFWDSESRGTADTIEKAKKAKKPTLIVYY
jgi:hypothetical protein